MTFGKHTDGDHSSNADGSTGEKSPLTCPRCGDDTVKNLSRHIHGPNCNP